MSDSLSQIIIPLQKQRTSPLSTHSVCHSRLLATPFGLLGSPCVSNLDVVECIFAPISQSASRCVAHQVAGGEECLLPRDAYLPPRKQASQCFVCRLLNCIMRRDAKSSNDMHGCYWSKVFGSIPPLWKLSTGELACERTGAIPCDFTFISKNRPSNNNKYTPSVLLWPRGKVVHFFLSPDVKDI